MRTAIAVCGLSVFLISLSPPCRGDDARTLPYGRYLVAVDDSLSPADVEALARSAAAEVQGRLELYSAVDFKGFVIVMAPSKLPVLGALAHVKSIKEWQSDSGSSRPTPTAARGTATVRSSPTAPPTQSLASGLQWTTGTFVYDGSGNVTAIGPGSDQKTDAYGYDGVSRLVDATAHTARSNNTQHFTYDALGNLIGVTSSDTGSLTIDVDTGTNRLKPSSAGGTGSSFTTGTYDAAGNQISFNGSYTYGYDSFSMMNEMVTAGRDELYVYDSDDERIAVVRLNGATSDDAAWSYALRDQAGLVLRNLDDTTHGGAHQWRWTKDYVYAKGSLLAAVSPLGTGEQRLHFHLDQVGSVRVTTDDLKRKLSLQTYWPYGKEAPGSETNAESMKYAGMERDTSDPNGLDYAQARYFGPVTGRFLSVDRQTGKTDDPQSLNRYAYSRGNPIRLVDPNGQFFRVLDANDVDFFAHQIALASRNRDARQLIQKLASDPNPYYLRRGNLDKGTLGEYVGKDNRTPNATTGVITLDEKQRAAMTPTRWRSTDVDRANIPDHFSALITFLHEIKHTDDFFYHGGSEYSANGDPPTDLSHPIRNINATTIPNTFERWAQTAANNPNDVNNAISETDAAALIVPKEVPAPHTLLDDNRELCLLEWACKDH